MKKHKLLGLILACIGVVLFATNEVGSAMRLVGMLGLIAGTIWFIVGRTFD